MTIHQFLQHVFVQPAARERLAQRLQQLGWIGLDISTEIRLHLELFPAASMLPEHTPLP